MKKERYEIIEEIINGKNTFIVCDNELDLYICWCDTKESAERKIKEYTIEDLLLEEA